MRFSQYLTVFPSNFNNIYLKSFVLLQNLMRNYEILQKFMIFHETNEIFLVKYLAFIQLRCTLLTFAFAISDFESRPQNFSFIWTDSKF
jgi:hypothetical protein